MQIIDGVFATLLARNDQLQDELGLDMAGDTASMIAREDGLPDERGDVALRCRAAGSCRPGVLLD